MKYAFVFAATQEDAFALAGLLMSIRDFAPLAANESDCIIYANDISERERELMRKILPSLQFLPLAPNKNIDRQLLDQCANFSPYSISSLLMTELLAKYDALVHLDVNQTVQREIQEIFHMEYDMAGVTLSYPLVSIKKSLPLQDSKADHPLLFRTILCLGKKSIHAFSGEKIRDGIAFLKDCNAFNLENLFSLLSYQNELKFMPLNRDTWGAPYMGWSRETKILHYFNPDTYGRPWKNDIAYAAFPAFAHYSFLWEQMGGKLPKIDYEKGLYNHRIAYEYLYSAHYMSSMLPGLDVIKNKYLEIKFDLINNRIRFPVKGFKDILYFELSRSNSSGFFNIVKLILDNDFLYNVDTAALFRNIHSQLSKINTAFKFIEKRNYIAIEIKAQKEDEINILLNLMINKAMEKIRNFFGISTQ